MHLLPATLGPIADMAARESGKFAICSVHLRVHGDNTFIAEATDTKKLIRVTGACVADSAEFPSTPAFENAPNGQSDALIPPDTWKSFFTKAKKLTARMKPALRAVAVKIGDKLATLNSTNLDQAPIEQTRLVEGTFPRVAEILPKSSRAIVVVPFDPTIMAETLKTIAALCPECHDGKPMVEMEVHERGPIILRSKDGTTMQVVGAVMPIGEVKTTKSAKDASNEQSEVAATDDPTAAIRCENEQLRGSLENRDSRITELLAQIESLRGQLQSIAVDKRQATVKTKVPSAPLMCRRDRLAQSRA